MRNINTALRAAGYTFDHDYGDFTVHNGGTSILVEVSRSGGYRETIVVETQLKREIFAGAAALTSGLAGNVGALPANLDLSRQRAAVAADRLHSYGVGPYSPVASTIATPAAPSTAVSS